MKNIPDYRCGRKKPHVLYEMLTYLIIGYSCGRTSVGRALEWGRSHVDFLREHMSLEHGIASEPTISRMLSGIDEEIFCLTFMEWVAEILKEQGIHIIIDGKALRGATEKAKDGAVPYVLNAIDAATQLVVGQLAISEKANEITAIPQLLELLDIKDNVFTIDAIGTQKKIEEKIVSDGGHFVLQVKKNNPALYEGIVTSFDGFREELKKRPVERNDDLKPCLEKYSKWGSQEKNRGRIEYRDFQACTNPTFLECVREDGMAYIKSVGCVMQVRIPVERDANGEDITASLEEFKRKGTHRKPVVVEGDGIRDDIQRVGMISDLELSAEEMAEYKRNHWRIENNLHHVLDDAFREDRSTATKSKNNLAVVRKYAYNLLRLAIIKEHPEWGIQRMMDHFCDHLEMAEKYIFSKIESFY